MYNVPKRFWLFVIVIMLICGIVCIWVCSMLCSNTTDLLEAIESENPSKVEEILKNGVDPNKTDIPQSRLWDYLEHSPKRPLTIACKTGNLKIVELLIEYGATAEPIVGTGFSPLREALFYFQPDDPEIVALLLDNGADTDDSQEDLAIFAAAQMIPRVYDKTKANGTVFSSGYDKETAMGITQIVEQLLKYKQIDITTPSGKTLLMLSAQSENLYLTEYLMSKGCDVSAVDANGKTALDYAVETKNEALILILRGGGTRGTRGRFCCPLGKS